MRYFQKQNGKNSKKNRNLPISTEILVSNSSKILDKFGWFQIRCFIFLSCTGFSIGMFMMSMIFFNIIPPFQCEQNQEFIVS